MIETGMIGTCARTAAEPLQLVAICVRLPQPLEAFRKNGDKLIIGQQPVRVLLTGQRGAGLASKVGGVRGGEDQVRAERPDVAADLVVDGRMQDYAVDRQRAGVVGY